MAEIEYPLSCTCGGNGPPLVPVSDGKPICHCTGCEVVAGVIRDLGPNVWLCSPGWGDMAKAASLDRSREVQRRLRKLAHSAPNSDPSVGG